MKRHVVGHLTLASLLASPALAQAQEAAQTLGTVSVTATGYETLVDETPSSVTVIEASEIRNREARTLGDLLRGQPGVATAVDGSVGSDPIIRGLKRDQVLVLVDGVRINAMQPPARGSLASYVNVDLIERIEIVRGPGSVLYGAGAMGGVINIITRGGDFTEKPETRGFSRLGVTSVDDGIRGAVGVTVSNDRNVLDLSTAYLNTDDYKTGDGDRLRDSGTEQNAYHLRYRGKLAPGHEVQFRAQRDERKDVWYLASRNFNTEEPGPGTIEPPLGLNTHYTPRQTRDLFELRYEGELSGAWAPRVEASVYRHELSRGNYDWNAQLGRDYRTSDTDFTTDGLRVQTELVPTDDQILLVGAEAWRLRASPESFFGTESNDFQPGEYVNPFIDTPQPLVSNGRIESVGIFVQHETYLDWGTVNLGVRYDEVSGKADDAFMVAPPLDKTDRNLSWSAGLTWHLDEAFNPYFSLSEGYRSASLLERYLTYPYSDGFTWLSNPQLEPERNRTFEVGARGHIGATSYTVSAYESRIRDYIGGEVIGDETKQTVNLDEARIHGLEALVEHAFTDAITGYASGTWIRGENRDSRFDEPLTQMPPPEASIGLSHTVAQGWQWDARVRAVASQSRTADTFTDGTERNTSGFATADLAVGYRFGPSAGFRSNEITFSVTNIANKTYREHVNEMTEARLDPANGVQDIWAPGRSFGLTWNAEF
ncbi:MULTISPECIES: TonB-dependent siderophore receptor [unclassified Thioalkalivibrio]|uniref:TonB-dependent receptor plug domain-containing protein n=1 Tax=unclassified Thioalkalivibrio TaxID=2621013 RepID=UPI00036F9094|nr:MULTISPECIES: TonB-dependent receptor [unclassified Thioalkalivibrio]